MKNPILRLAIPNIISNISVPLVGIVDLALMGHMDSELHLNAVAIGASIFSFIYLSFGFLRMSTTGFVAQAFGEKNQQNMWLTFQRSLVLGFAIAFLLLVFQIPIGQIAVQLLGAQPEVNTEALKYFHIRIFAAPATLGLYSIMAWFIGRQNTRTPLFLALLINVGNVIFNLLFIFGFGMKSDGVALGTVLAQYSGFFIGLLLVRKSMKGLSMHWDWPQILDSAQVKRFFAVNRDIFIRTILLLVTITFFTASSARMSAEILAVNTLLFQFFMFFTYLIDGFANAAEALVGKNIGEKAIDKLKPLIGEIFLWGLLISTFFSLIYFFLGRNILQLLTNLPQIVTSSEPYLFWVGLLPLLSFSAFIWDGVYIGATKAVPMRNSMMISTLLVFFPLYFIFQPLLGNHGLWLAFIAFLVSRGLFLFLLSPRYIFAK